MTPLAWLGGTRYRLDPTDVGVTVLFPSVKYLVFRRQAAHQHRLAIASEKE